MILFGETNIRGRKQNLKYTRQPFTLLKHMQYKHKKTRQMLEANEMKVLRKIVDKTKIDRIRSEQIRESCIIQPINE